MNLDSSTIELHSSCGTPGNPPSDEPVRNSDHHIQDPVLVWAPSGRRLISGLLGMNVVLLGAALVAGEAFNPSGLKHQEPQVFMLLLMGVSLVWMLWYLLWARKQPGISPHEDHHAGGITVMMVLLLFAACSLLLHVCRTGYLINMIQCKAAITVLFTFVESPFLALQCFPPCLFPETANSTFCQCSASAQCLVFRKGFEILYPFNIEYYLMAGCMIYVMWENVGRRMGTGHHHGSQKFTVNIVYQGGIIYGLVLGGLVLIAGATVFILYQVWVSQHQLRHTAFLIFYGYHLVVMPVMSLFSLAGLLVHRLERRAHEGGHNPTRSLDVLLLVAAAIGQLALSYFSLVAALAVGTQGPLGNLDLSYSLLSLMELILQNIFIIEGLHRHPKLLAKKKERSNIFTVVLPVEEKGKIDISVLDASVPPVVQEHDEKKSWTKRVIQEICVFLILSNIMLWVIPAFGVHPQFENGLGKQFFGFSAWFVMVNLGQPLSVFYRMHSVGALMELFITA
ncbi:proton channel OTOP2-like [Thunnus maccoyii]|uniref:proton channel OTOP2-like n=1 Tax=Thunnus maccoyii TaxID=8240 RepID=UPI001C4CA321|nr:proton channel OTOP2-like [Thunnus maccoyii]